MEKKQQQQSISNTRLLQAFLGLGIVLNKSTIPVALNDSHTNRVFYLILF